MSMFVDGLELQRRLGAQEEEIKEDFKEILLSWSDELYEKSREEIRKGRKDEYAPTREAAFHRSEMYVAQSEILRDVVKELLEDE